MKLDVSKMRLLGNQLLVELLESKDDLLDTTSSGILVYNKMKHKGRQVLAKIEKLGVEFSDRNMRFKMEDVFSLGDVVTMYAPAANNKITDTISGKDFYLVRAEDIDAIIDLEEGEM